MRSTLCTRWACLCGYICICMKLNTRGILPIYKSDGGKQLRGRAGILKWSFKMFMYILLRLEMYVCTSGRFLNFPRWGPAGPEGQIYFCCMTGRVLSGKQLPRSTHCTTALYLCNQSERRVQICSSHPSGCSLHSPAPVWALAHSSHQTWPA